MSIYLIYMFGFNNPSTNLNKSTTMCILVSSSQIRNSLNKSCIKVVVSSKNRLSPENTILRWQKCESFYEKFCLIFTKIN
jgi:hypothetical protein